MMYVMDISSVELFDADMLLVDMPDIPEAGANFKFDLASDSSHLTLEDSALADHPNFHSTFSDS